MSILRIKEFQKVYPKLWETVNTVRIATGSNRIDEEYPERFSVPIRMFDANLAESFLEKNKIEDADHTHLGYTNLIKIINAVKNEPNMLRWLDILYYPNNPKGLYTDRYNTEINKFNKPQKRKKVTNMAKSNKIEGEIILTVSVSETDPKLFVATNSEGVDVTADVNDQKKLKYAHLNKGCIRGRVQTDGLTKWRVVKEKFITATEPAVIE